MSETAVETPEVPEAPVRKKPGPKPKPETESATVSFKGETFEVKPAKDLPFEFLEAIESYAPVKIVSTVLGDEQMATVRKVGATVEEFMKLAEDVLEAVGIDSLGN